MYTPLQIGGGIGPRFAWFLFLDSQLEDLENLEEWHFDPVQLLLRFPA
jgi:hypothetical protein